MTPNDRKYTKSHEWVKIDGDLAVVGVTDHAQRAMGDVTYVEMPGIDRKVKQGDVCAVIESVKAASDLLAPVSGTVVEVNEVLADTPETTNQAPYGAGWILKLHKINAVELASLLDATAYEAFIEKGA